MDVRFSSLVLLALVLGACAGARGDTPLHKDALPDGVRIDRLVLEKGRHRLEAWSGKNLLKVYRVAIGRGSKGPKLQSGDNRTPEGRYRIDSRHRSKTFHRFLHVSYPNREDRRRFKASRQAGELPADARIGGAIGIHGERKGREWLPHKWADWTQGCVAVDNDEIEELYRAVKDGASFEIRP